MLGWQMSAGQNFFTVAPWRVGASRDVFKVKGWYLTSRCVKRGIDFRPRPNALATRLLYRLDTIRDHLDSSANTAAILNLADTGAAFVRQNKVLTGTRPPGH
jgi:hypothetical protein